MEPKILIVVVGPTAIGKTSLAILVARHFRTQIISADSRQFFKEMGIGTAVPSEEELRSAPHHLIQHKSIFEPYSVGDFEREALSLLEQLFDSHDTLVLVGGSGLYVDALVHGLDEFPKTDPGIREALVQKFRQEGLESLQMELLDRDPEYYHKVDLGNPHRLIRALEICIGSERPYSSFLGQSKPERPFKALYIGLEAPRKTLYGRIDARVDLMMDKGLLEEARKLYPHRQLNALQTVGYKELFEYLDGNCSLETAVSEIKKSSRRYAKRQLTWLRKNKNIIWVEYDTRPNIILERLTEEINSLKDAQSD